jgi:hypothetical protein
VSNEIQPNISPDQARAIERVVVEGDLSQLTAADRVAYYRHVCASLGLNWATRPFDYLRLNSKLQLYANKNCAAQLRRVHGVSVTAVSVETKGGMLIATAHGRDAAGREDTATGAVWIEGLKGDAAANAAMKAETKAKRRLALSLCGLGYLDESEIETVRDAQVVAVDSQTGEIIEPPALRRPQSTASASSELPPNAPEPSTRPISAAQVERLWAKMRAANRDKEDLRIILSERYGITSTKDIPVSLYDEIIAWIESPPVQT